MYNYGDLSRTLDQDSFNLLIKMNSQGLPENDLQGILNKLNYLNLLARGASDEFLYINNDFHHFMNFWKNENLNAEYDEFANLYKDLHDSQDREVLKSGIVKQAVNNIYSRFVQKFK